MRWHAQSYRCKLNISFCHGGNKRSSWNNLQAVCFSELPFLVCAPLSGSIKAHVDRARARTRRSFVTVNFYLFGRDPRRCRSVTDPRATTMTCVITISRQQLSKRESTINFPSWEFLERNELVNLWKISITALLIRIVEFFAITNMYSMYLNILVLTNIYYNRY